MFVPPPHPPNKIVQHTETHSAKAGQDGEEGDPCDGTVVGHLENDESEHYDHDRLEQHDRELTDHMTHQNLDSCDTCKKSKRESFRHEICDGHRYRETGDTDIDTGDTATGTGDTAAGTGDTATDTGDIGIDTGYAETGLQDEGDTAIQDMRSRTIRKTELSRKKRVLFLEKKMS